MRLLLFTIYLILSIPAIVFPQKISTPLEPAAPPRQFELGLLFALGGNNQIGEFNPGKYFNECKNCNFIAGDGIGSTIGILAQRDLIDELQYGAIISMVFSNIKSEYQETEIIPIPLLNNNYDYRPIPFRNTAEFSFSMLNFEPYIRWQPLGFIFIKFGFSASILTTYHIKQSKELLKFKDTLSTGEIVDLQIDNENPKLKVVDDRNIPEINPFQMYLHPTVGFNIPLSQKFSLSPYFAYSIPLSKISNLQDNFKLSNWRIGFEFKYALKLRKSPIVL